MNAYPEREGQVKECIGSEMRSVVNLLDELVLVCCGARSRPSSRADDRTENAAARRRRAVRRRRRGRRVLGERSGLRELSVPQTALCDRDRPRAARAAHRAESAESVQVAAAARRACE